MDCKKENSEDLFKSLDRLEEAVVDFEKNNAVFKDHVRLFRTLRDSMIKRFELCEILFLKCIKLFLEEELGMPHEFYAPKSIIRGACNAKLISEQDAELILKMLEDQNMSSHIYKEEVADIISAKIPEYYKTMKKYVDKLVQI